MFTRSQEDLERIRKQALNYLNSMLNVATELSILEDAKVSIVDVRAIAALAVKSPTEEEEEDDRNDKHNNKTYTYDYRTRSAILSSSS